MLSYEYGNNMMVRLCGGLPFNGNTEEEIRAKIMDMEPNYHNPRFLRLSYNV